MYAVERPEVPLPVLNPFNIGNTDAAGVCQNIRNYDDSFFAEDLVGFERRRRSCSRVPSASFLQQAGGRGADVPEALHRDGAVSRPQPEAIHCGQRHDHHTPSGRFLAPVGSAEHP